MIEIRKGTLAHLKEKEEEGAEVPRAMDDEAQVGLGGSAPEPPGLLEAVQKVAASLHILIRQLMRQ